MKRQSKRVYVLIDHQAASRAAIPVGAVVAQAADASLHVLHISDKAETPVDMFAHLGLKHEELRNATLESLAGAPAEVMRSELDRYPDSLIVMPFRAAPEGSGLGPVSLEILRGVRCPVLLVPPKVDWEQWKPHKVLIPQDSTAGAAAALAPLGGVLSKIAAHVLILHVPKYGSAGFKPEEDALPLPRYLDQPQHAIAAWQEEFMARVRLLGEMSKDVKLELHLVGGEPAEEVVAAAHNTTPDLIAVPWCGRYERAAILRAALESGDCPILALPTPTSSAWNKKAA